jgi:D-alanine-D-alanine ligase
MITEKKIGVLMGGNSFEREVSLKSGAAVYKALSDIGYNVVSIDVGRDIPFVLRDRGVELSFVILHGGYGENGTLQGLLEVMGIPYTGSGVLASALAMDKIASKKIFMYHKLPVPAFQIFTNNVNNVDQIRIDFPLPWVVKPAFEGSSIGVSIVRQKDKIIDALKHAFFYSKAIIVEKYIQGKEVQIGILGNRALGGVEVRPSLEFYNFEAKYTAGLTEYIIPPKVNLDVYKKAEQIALQSHNVLGCSGVTRVDLIIEDSGNPYVLEVNTIPGMTETSLIPKIAAHAGMTFSQILEEMIRLAVEKPRP